MTDVMEMATGPIFRAFGRPVQALPRMRYNSRMNERPDRCLLCEARLSNPVCQMAGASLTRFSALTNVVSYHAGQKLFTQGDRAGTVFLVRTGQVKLTHEHVDGVEQVLRMAGPGETLGVGASEDHEVNVSAVATLSTTVCRTRLPEVEALVRADPEFALVWAHLLMDEIHRSREAILNLGPHPAIIRMARFLLSASRDQIRLQSKKARKTSKAAPTWGPLVVRTTHSDLASSLSIAQETATRLLGTLEEAHVVKLLRGKIEILDLDRLAAVGGYPGSDVDFERPEASSL